VGVGWAGTGEVAGVMPMTGLMTGASLLRLSCEGVFPLWRMWRTVPVGLM